MTIKFKQNTFKTLKPMKVGMTKEEPEVIGSERCHLLTDREMAKMSGGRKNKFPTAKGASSHGKV